MPITTYHYLLLPQATYYDNTRRDQIDIRNSPRLYTIAQTLRQKQYFENSQIPGETRKKFNQQKKNHNEHFQMQQREITHRGAQ